MPRKAQAGAAFPGGVNRNPPWKEEGGVIAARLTAPGTS